MVKKNNFIGFLAFSMYFLTGATCVIVGSSLPQLVDMYAQTIEKVALLGSAYALGRVLTVYVTGILVEKLGPLKVLSIGALLTGLFLVGIPLFGSFYIGMIFAFIGGVGMGTQDAVCPTLLSRVFKKGYASSLSFGQGLFGVGTTVSPFIIGLLLSNKISFTWSYYILSALAVVIFVLALSIKDTKDSSEKENEEHITPLLTKNVWLAYLGIFLVVAAFSAVSSAIGLYTTSFAISKGISETNAAFMFTVYNIGCVLGGFVFVWVLKYVKSQTVLLINCTCAFISILVAMIVNNTTVYFIGLFVAGLFLGVLFSVIIAIATRIGYKRVSIACSLVATASGIADFLTPVITGSIIANLGVSFAFTFALIMLGVCIVSAALLKFTTYEN